MDIKILDSHLREYLTTTAKSADIAKALSLSSASVERLEKWGADDFVYAIEVTTNRADMLCVQGLAREAAAVLPEFGFRAEYKSLKIPDIKKEIKDSVPLHIVNDKTLVRRICAVVLEVEIGQSPAYIKDRLESSGIRSLNSLIDITNYVMLDVGHPTHAFDYDRLANHTLVVRPSKNGETIRTLDKKEHILQGGDIVADNGNGEIVDLLGVMGLDNSVVTNNTKRILFFIDNNDPWKIRKTSMGLGIRTEAAVLNEKGVDPQLAMQALLRGVQLYKQIAHAKVVSDVVDIYPQKSKPITITIPAEKISQTVGVEIPVKRSVKILEDLGFEVTGTSTLHIRVPSWREEDVTIPEDIIEEVARIYGYHNIPSFLPPFTTASYYHQNSNPFFWEQRIKDAFKYWGFTEVYTYSMVSETLFEGPIEKAITLSNPLDAEHVYMRASLTPSLLQVVAENKGREDIAIFELANMYESLGKKTLPHESQNIAFVLKGNRGDFYHAKGVIEQLAEDLGITNLLFQESDMGGVGATILLGKEKVGNISVLDKNLVTAELSFEKLLLSATLKKVYMPLSKFPKVTQDLSFTLPEQVKTGDVLDVIKKQHHLIIGVSLLDIYQTTRTFHIEYQSKERNLTTEEVGEIQKKVIAIIEKKFKAKVK